MMILPMLYMAAGWPGSTLNLVGRGKISSSFIVALVMFSVLFKVS
jgi:hypothetical protein